MWSRVYSAVIVIEMVSVQNLLAPFRYIFEKDTLRHFPLLGGLTSNFKFQSYHCKTKNQNKTSTGQQCLGISAEAGRVVMALVRSECSGHTKTLKRRKL